MNLSCFPPKAYIGVLSRISEKTDFITPTFPHTYQVGIFLF